MTTKKKATVLDAMDKKNCPDHPKAPKHVFEGGSYVQCSVCALRLAK